LCNEATTKDIFKETEKRVLSIESLKQQSAEMQKELLRDFLTSAANYFKCSHSETPCIPSHNTITHLLTNVIHAKKDSSPLFKWLNLEIRRYNHFIYIHPSLTLPNEKRDLRWYLDKQNIFTLPQGKGQLAIERTKGQGLRLPSEACLDIRFRQGGEKIYLQKCHKTLKNIFQQMQVPPWKRNQYPLIYWEEELIAIAGLLLSEKFLTDSEQEGIVFKFTSG
jgi:tRNA(Ile)-lysidine synthase